MSYEWWCTLLRKINLSVANIIWSQNASYTKFIFSLSSLYKKKKKELAGIVVVPGMAVYGGVAQ